MSQAASPLAFSPRSSRWFHVFSPPLDVCFRHLKLRFQEVTGTPQFSSAHMIVMPFDDFFALVNGMAIFFNDSSYTHIDYFLMIFKDATCAPPHRRGVPVSSMALARMTLPYRPATSRFSADYAPRLLAISHTHAERAAIYSSTCCSIFKIFYFI